MASTGNDANDGSRGSPKRNFQSAHDAVAAGGQIVVLDTAGYGQLNINKSLAVTVPPGVNGFVTVSGTNNAITVAAGAGSRVSLRGLIIEGGGSRASIGSGPGFGIYVLDVGTLTVEDCTIRNFLDALVFAPANAGASPLTVLAVYNTSVRNCSYGIDVQTPAGVSGVSIAYISGCRLDDLGDAIYSTNAYVRVEDSVVFNCDTGLHSANGNITTSACKFETVSRVIAGNGNFGSFGNNTIVGASPFNANYPLK